MSRVITFSRVFPKYHPKAGQPTYFVEKLWTDLFWQNIIDNRNMDEPLLEEEIKNFYTKTFEGKGHTIRKGNRWKVGDWFSPRVWGNDINPKSGKSGPYQSKQIMLTPLIQVKKIWNIRINMAYEILEINGNDDTILENIALNDGLSIDDFLYWFGKKDFYGQIICWNENICY